LTFEWQTSPSRQVTQLASPSTPLRLSSLLLLLLLLLLLFIHTFAMRVLALLALWIVGASAFGRSQTVRRIVGFDAVLVDVELMCWVCCGRYERVDGSVGLGSMVSSMLLSDGTTVVLRAAGIALYFFVAAKFYVAGGGAVGTDSCRHCNHHQVQRETAQRAKQISKQGTGQLRSRSMHCSLQHIRHASEHSGDCAT
jgi:hypothetical protein